ncbi:hypothetical protein BOSEA31B_14510 [Hyphomicrobiales bacterium]|nr:hypothetical protein BOSEA31B_14510 [Hyphomicrobiales bacterium]CAH1700285.1 hypothetical protein BOSEA1005_13338 [Hyphomicrobiales bacterium]CAI0344063.1 hypothetical protein BO1005MUT1_310092 [Hyphomicrobiales bacterium]
MPLTECPTFGDFADHCRKHIAPKPRALLRGR